MLSHRQLDPRHAPALCPPPHSPLGRPRNNAKSKNRKRVPIPQSDTPRPSPTCDRPRSPRLARVRSHHQLDLRYAPALCPPPHSLPGRPRNNAKSKNRKRVPVPQSDTPTPASACDWLRSPGIVTRCRYRGGEPVTSRAYAVVLWCMMRSSVETPNWALVLSLALAASASAQAPPSTFKSKVNLVMVPVVVRDRDGRPVGNLTQDDFQLSDSGRKQVITKFSVEKAAPEDGQKPAGEAKDAGVRAPESTTPRFVAHAALCRAGVR